ncbi:MAG: cobyrinate a,c-diamide synthase [Nitrospinota bacterium]|nr:cobyrinate a,c-diamide synthase [Nitrospinota bacterium]
MLKIPRIVIAGTQSGVGKTSFSLGLIRALTRKGLRVAPFKVGPDFLDPTYLRLAARRQCHNLDGWMMGQDYVTSLFSQAAAGADVAVVEGVMGMFDGIAPNSLEGSTAQMASILKAPVILVVDAGGMAGSLAAMAMGYAGFHSEVKVAGVIANKVGSPGHATLLKAALETPGAPPLLGGIVRGSFPELKSRHLGLVTATQRGDVEEKLDMLADGVEKEVDLESVMAMARQAPPMAGAVSEEKQPDPYRARLGVAWDSAFHFYYPDNLKAMEDAGLELVRFSPISDRKLPEGLDAIYYGGGYPEQHAEELAGNETMLQDVRSFFASGRPVYAECGGLIYLSRGVEDGEGKKWPMVGKLAAWTRMLGRFRALGYVEARLTRPSLFGAAGDRLRGHRFHYSELMEDPMAEPEWSQAYELVRPRNGEKSQEGYQHGRTLASYAHIHFASAPGATAKFAEQIMEVKEG